MLPTLQPGDVILCRGQGRIPVRGDIVVFEHPHRPGFTLVKRVIGVPGELITIEDGEVHIDGHPGADRWAGLATNIDDAYPAGTYPDGEFELGPEAVFVLSDNRAATRDDSRSFGPIPVAGTRGMWFRLGPRRPGYRP